jgi:putative ABC transport system substrate-binding protein
VPARVQLLILAALSVPLQAPVSPPPHGDPTRVIVVVSQDAAPFRDALAGFKRELEHGAGAINWEIVQLQGEPARATQMLAQTQAGRVKLVLALGTLATHESLLRFPGTPVVAGMILTASEIEGAPNATGVFLQFPVETELEWLARLLPGQRRVGVLYHSAEAKGRVSQAERLAAGANLNIESYQIDAPQEIPDALESLANRADVLWGITDPMIYNSETAKSLLVFSFRHQIPLIGLSTPWVKAGALYALDRDYQDIGVQCAQLAEKILEGRTPGSLQPVPPRKVRYSLNQRTATQMKLQFPERVLREAAEVVE